MRFAGCLLIALLVGSCSDKGQMPAESSTEIDLWEPIGWELPAPATALCAGDSGLVAATSETLPGEAVLWRWQDGTWVQMAPPLTGAIYAVTWFQGSLVAGGMFDVDSNPAIRSLARWDGSSWMPVGPPLDGAGIHLHAWVSSMTPWRDRLAVGGFFTVDEPGTMALWDGQILESLPCRLRVADLAV